MGYQRGGWGEGGDRTEDIGEVGAKKKIVYTVEDCKRKGRSVDRVCEVLVL